MTHPALSPTLGAPNVRQLRRYFDNLEDGAHTPEYAAGVADARNALDRMWAAAVEIAEAYSRVLESDSDA